MKRALLIAGGIASEYYDIRYRNDLGAYYRLLFDEYGYNRDQIRVYFAAGGWHDIDGDGRREEVLPATLVHIREGIEWLAELGAGDFAFLLASNHGEPDGLCVWGRGDLLTPAMLESALGVSAATKLLVFGQCFAGRFATLSLAPSVTLCACGPDEPSYPHPHKNYDEFLYHLATALGGACPDDDVPAAPPPPSPTIADAFDYARTLRRRPETPILADPDGLAAALRL